MGNIHVNWFSFHHLLLDFMASIHVDASELTTIHGGHDGSSKHSSGTAQGTARRSRRLTPTYKEIMSCSTAQAPYYRQFPTVKASDFASDHFLPDRWRPPRVIVQ